MRTILLGPPGSGKGTQGERIEKKYGLPKISTGDLLRHEVEKGTSLGKKAEATMNRGELVSDDLIIALVRKRIFVPDCQKGYVMDGFPRNVYQAQALEKLDRRHRDVVFDIQLKDQTLIERLSGRRICSSCEAIYNLAVRSPEVKGLCDACGGNLIQRKDDSPRVVRDRLKVYEEQTKPLIEYYKKKKIYHSIHGEGNIESIFENICSILDLERMRSEEVTSIR
jgi:adenylate kinase